MVTSNNKYYEIIVTVKKCGSYTTYSLSKDISNKLVENGYVVEKYTSQQICDGITTSESYWIVLPSNR